MATRRYIAVVGIEDSEAYKKTVALATGVNEAMTANSLTYGLPNPSLAALLAQVGVVNGYDAQVLAGDHSKIALRAEGSVSLYSMLQDETEYVNTVALGNKGLIELSGFRPSKEPVPQPVPIQVVIKRIVDGVIPGTAKIYIGSMGQNRLTFVVQMATVNSPAFNFVTVLTTRNSRKLIVPDMPNGVRVWIRVQAISSAGEGLWSTVTPFISQN